MLSPATNYIIWNVLQDWVLGYFVNYYNVSTHVSNEYSRMYLMPDLILTRNQKYIKEAQGFAKMTIIASLILKFAIEQSQNGWRQRMLVGN